MRGHWLKNMFSEWGGRRKGVWTGKLPWIKPRKGASPDVQKPDLELELSDYHRLPDHDNLSPGDLLQGESTKSEVISDLDAFFGRLYRYYCDKGLWCIVIQWVVELLSLGFTICFSGFFLLLVDWNVLHTCGADAVEPCDLIREAIKEYPLEPFTITKIIVVVYLLLFSLYWVFCFLRFFAQLRQILEVRHFYQHRLQVTDRELQTTSWPVLLDKIVQYQQQQRLCVIRELSVHDVVMRIMRKENYLIGMLNKGVLAVALPSWILGCGPVARHGTDGTERRLLLTKTLEWSLNWCILHQMFDSNFQIREDFVDNPILLKRRLRIVGITMLVLSPFLIIFMFVYFFLRHAEEFYHHPSTAASRRWSNLAKWIFREFNELDHMFNQRLNCSYKHAVEYMKQFPSIILSILAKFVSFVAGGFAAILLIVAVLDESLLEAHLFGRNLIWFAAVFGTITAISRSFITEEFLVFEPEKSLRLVACFTHYMPKHWRGSENTDSVHREFESLFQYTGMTLLEDLISIFTTPYTLLFLLPKQVDDVLQFIRNFTLHIEGVGDVCSLSVFDFEHHGNKNYGSPIHTTKEMRSSQGKMEKSFLSFQSSYPHWDPPITGKHFLSVLVNAQLQSSSMGLAGASQSLQVARQVVPTLDRTMLSMFMQPGLGYKWPLSSIASQREPHVSQQFRQCEGEYPLADGRLDVDQLYWLVDRFYASQNVNKSTAHQPPSFGVFDAEDDHCSHANEALHSEVSSYRDGYDHAVYEHPIETSDAVAHDRVFNFMKGSDQPVYECSGSSKNGSVYTDLHQDEWHQSALQATRTSALAHGSFLEPPMFGVGHFAGSGYGSSLDNIDEHQERAWHSQRTYASIAIEENKVSPDFNLPFGDLYDRPQGAIHGHEGKDRL